jgi:hypothetical protein
VIIRAAWSGGTTEEVVIPVIYRDPVVARSHYRFVRDWSEGFAVLGGAVLLRIVNPTTRWAPDGARSGELAWPAVPGGRLTGLLAVVAAGISATVVSAVALAGANGHMTLFATGVVAVAAVRTRTPIVAVAAGAAAGIAAPAVLLPLAMPAATCASLLFIDRLRRNAGASTVRG